MEHYFAAQSRVPARWDGRQRNEHRPSARAEDVLILTSSTGAGHDSVAVALREALHELAPEAGVRIFDPLSGGRTNGPLSPARVYGAMVAHAPWLWGVCYHATNNAWAVRLGMAAGALPWARRLRAVIQTERPGLVVAVHPLCTRLAADVLCTLPGAPPLHCVVTDLVTIHACWGCKAVAAYYVATSDASDALAAIGIPRDRIYLTGLPLRASFAQAPDAPDDGSIPRVLVLGGGRRIERIARALMASRLPLELIVVCGRDRRLRQRLTRVLDTRATVLGWRDDIAALMRWSSVVITKAGPTTLAEALSQTRPVVVFQALRGQEAGNVALVTRAGSGRYIPRVDALARAVTTWPRARLLGDPAQAGWWGTSARRVAARLVAARADQATAPYSLAPSLDGDAEVGRVIDNPISGERIIIRETGARTGGQVLSFDLFLPPRAHVPSRHVHPIQEERFTVVAGQLGFRLGRLGLRRVLANPGDTVVVPAGMAHWFGNVGAGVMHARVEARPALRMEEMFESAAAMGRAGCIPGTRMPRPTRLAHFLIEFQREVAVPDLPASLVKIVLAPLAWLGRRGRGAAPEPAS